MPTLFKRSNGFYYVILADQFGQRRWVSTKERTKRGALSRLAVLVENHREAVPRVKLQEFYKDFKEYALKIYSSETVSVYDRAFTQFNESCGNRILASVTEKHIDEFKAKRLQEIRFVTVNIELRTLRSAFYTAVRWKLIKANPFKDVRLCAIDDVVPPYFSLLDFTKVISAIDKEWFRQVLIVAVLTGMRRGELLNLRWSDIDLEKRLICVQSKGNFRTKNGRRRIIPMNPHVFDVISLLSKNQGEYVFTCEGEKILDRGLSLRFKRLVRKLKLNKALYFHSLRHSFASWLVQEGVSLYDIQKLLGHSNIRVTEKYSHLVPEQLHNIVSKIPFDLN